MEANIINALGTIGFGGGVAVVIAFLAYRQFESQSKLHKETIDRICASHETDTQRICESFEYALDRRDKDIVSLVNEIRLGRSGVING